MEVKDIIKEDKSKIVPSYEYRDYYREDGSHLYNSRREANWYEIGVHDGYEYALEELVQNRVVRCNKISGEALIREMNFIHDFIKEHNCVPTISDAIEVTRKQMIEKATKWIEYYNNNGGCLFDDWKDDFVKAMEE